MSSAIAGKLRSAWRLTRSNNSTNRSTCAWVNEIKVVTGPDGSVKEWRVNLRVTFIVD